MVGGNHAGERLFNGLTIAIMILLMIMTVYPFWFSVISSFNSGGDLLRGPCFCGRESSRSLAGRQYCQIRVFFMLHGSRRHGPLL